MANDTVTVDSLKLRVTFGGYWIGADDLVELAQIEDGVKQALDLGHPPATIHAWWGTVDEPLLSRRADAVFEETVDAALADASHPSVEARVAAARTMAGRY